MVDPLFGAQEDVVYVLGVVLSKQAEECGGLNSGDSLGIQWIQTLFLLHTNTSFPLSPSTTLVFP